MTITTLVLCLSGTHLVYLFEYLATLGMIDISYTLLYFMRPDFYDLWGSEDIDFLSCYDGLRYIRLNALGAYCLGITDHYVESKHASPPLLNIDASFAISLLRAAAPSEKMTLQQYTKNNR